jgi:hypothetical protein
MNAREVEVLVFTFKDGALSALAHDLKLKVTALTLEKDEQKVTASFEAGSLRVVCPQKDGQDSAGLLPKALYGEIEKNAAKDVLEAAKFPSIRFESTAVTEAEVVGQLTLHGVTREVRCARKPGGVVEARLDQRTFGIKPYSAMFGTLKVKPEVVVTVRVLS